jgi:hypothetical protein
MRNITLLITIFIIFCQCKTNKNSDSRDYTDPTEKAFKIQDTDSTLDLLTGKWFMPHNAGINITFTNDSTFVFNDFNTKLLKEEVLTGKFQLKTDRLILIYNDRPQQIFNFKKGEGIDNNYYITKGKKYYFVKSSDGND